MSLDLDAIVAKWLNACGSCDAGLPTSCTCSADDPRPPLGALVEEVQRLRAEVDAGDTFHCYGLHAENDRLRAELEEERRNSAALREQRDRAVNELGEALERPPVVLCALCEPPAVIAASGLADHNAWNHDGNAKFGEF